MKKKNGDLKLSAKLKEDKSDFALFALPPEKMSKKLFVPHDIKSSSLSSKGC